jgi:nucleotide-binding universal stress UspA family protein
MFKNALVGVDGRAGGRDAIALAGRLVGPDGRLTLAHVHHGELSEENGESHELLERVRSEAGVEAELVSVVATSPGRGLHERAEALGADLLAVGSCARSTVGRAMLGDDTRAALNGAPCAVAVAALGYGAKAAPIAKVGVAYNGSAESDAALASARELAAASGAKVIALEVVSLPAVTYGALLAPAIGESIDSMIAEANARLQQLPGVEGRAVFGLPGEELAAFGDELDLLVVGSRGYGPVRRLVVGSTSDYLERHARCSLLVLTRV